jgi:hypothetical protein
MLDSPWFSSFVSPGQLSSVHLAIQDSEGLENCSVCHVNADADATGWFKGAFSSVELAHETVNDACLDCHFTEPGLARQQSMLVHGSSPFLVEERTQAAVSTEAFKKSPPFTLKVASFIQGPVSIPEEGLACASCHSEHRGSEHDLLVMSNNECQSCHQKTFSSFNDGHPQFTPDTQGSVGIVFDHVKHERRFKAKVLDCGSCHVGENSFSEMGVLPFEMSCQGCHEQGSKDHHGDKIKKNIITVLQLPEIEFDEDVYWPADHAIGEALTPLMALMLLGDPQAVPLLESIFDEDGADGDLYEWLILTDDEDEPELRSDLAQALKRLVADLSDSSKQGARIRRERLSRAMSVDSDDQRLADFGNELDAASFVMQRFQQRFLPQLADDLDGTEVSADDDEEPESDWLTSSAMAGWRVDSDEGSISYRPIAHGDALLGSLMSLMQVNVPEGSTKAVVMDRVAESFEDDFRSCSRCHAVQGTEIAWTSSARVRGLSGFAKFNHGPHLAMLASSSECTSCHVLETSLSGEQVQGITAVRGFLPQRIETCESCHAEGLVNNSCVNCHQYHEHRPGG